jgi:tripartite ATP-independent transporter DctP family solute receptor
MAAEQTLKFGHAASSTHLFQGGLEMFAAAVAEKTGGRVEVQVFGDRQLGDDKQLLEGAQLGTIDGALVSSPTFPLAAGAKAFDALQLPFLLSSYDQVGNALTSPVAQKMLDSLAEKNMKGLGFYEAGLRHFLSRDKQVESVADFAGLKTRIVPIPLHKQTWEAVGTNPIGMAYGEVYSGLETGTIDAVEINLSSIQSESLYQNAKHVTLTGHYFWPGVLVMNKARFDGLPEDIQKALVEAGKETIQAHYRLAAEQEEKSAAFLKEQGVTIGELTDLDAMRARMQPILEQWSDQDPLIREFIDMVEQGS